MLTSAGIDYGNGATNIDHETGIRYGVIAVHGVTQAWADCSEPDYGPPMCPACGADVVNCADIAPPDDCEQCGGQWAVADYYCESCNHTLDSCDCFPDEAISYVFDNEGYSVETCFDGACLMVLESPYYTFARFCSPCVPGAGDLDNPDSEHGVKTYCLGHDWFDDGKAPYPVFPVR